nr:unnamed protein product [Callosobruchus analis]
MLSTSIVIYAIKIGVQFLM